jgi:hypothetical protein
MVRLSSFNRSGLYVSRPTRNADRLPWKERGSGLRHSHVPGVAYGPQCYFDPRVDLTEPHPRANPLLLDFRHDPFFPDLIDRARNYLEVNLSDMSPEATAWDCTPDQIEHARRVLTRLVNLSTPEGAS